MSFEFLNFQDFFLKLKYYSYFGYEKQALNRLNCIGFVRKITFLDQSG